MKPERERRKLMARTIRKIKNRERPKAWIYSAINPILEALKIESGFLEKGNWTFRQHSRDLEFIRPLEAYVDYQSRPNWVDFVSSNSSVRDRVTHRDEQREELRKACGAAFTYVVTLQGFEQKVSDCVLRFTRGGEPAQLGQRPQDVVAELIVNNIRELPSHYGYHRFWSMFGGELRQFRVGQAFDRADQAGLELKKSNDGLSAELVKVRSALAAEYDIPWAPYYDESLSLPGR